MTQRINLISCPRNLSTALMYSFAQRDDTLVVDEPLYANYLHRTGIEHPGRDETIESMDTDLEKVKSDVIFADYDKPVFFIKNMSHHLYDIDESFILDLDNIIYIRNPKQIIASFAKVIENPGIRDIGVEKQFELHQYLTQHGKDCIVLDSGELLKDPKKVLKAVCERLSIDFQEAMLKWDPKPRPEDGVWAKYWYKNVHQSTGFSRQPTSDRPLPEGLEPLYQEAIGYYDQLYNLAIKA